jgi:transcriptional regulator with GAF, ATPase, and Fis domain
MLGLELLRVLPMAEISSPSGERADPQQPESNREPGCGDLLGPLLRTLAESLDVREIFARISAEAGRIVPHDFLILGLLSEDHQRSRLIALSGDLPEGLQDHTVPDQLRVVCESDGFVLNDVRMRAGSRTVTGGLRVDGKEPHELIEVEQPLLRELVSVRGFRSFLSVPVRLRGGELGGLFFCSTAPDAYAPGDVARARLIAHCVTLALAHQRLAEEEQRSAEARARAALLETRVQRLTEELEAQGRYRILGQSRKWRDVLAQATKVAPTEATVLLSGESGTGKEVVARFIHRASGRAEGPFVALNCAALPEQLLESELFGHERGAFTGAVAPRPGKIEQAAGGVLFLDEVGEMSPSVQAKFLRVLQEREYQRVGGVRTLKAEVRVLAATNRNLKAALADGTFREDLYYRLAVLEIALPPLRERREDILLLAKAFADDIGHSIGRRAAGATQEVREKLVEYAWPGNVRELRNVVERALILCDGGVVTSEHLALDMTSAQQPSTPSSAAVPLGAGTLDAVEREMILDALARAGNNKSKAARTLGLTRGQFRSRIEKHGLTMGS